MSFLLIIISDKKLGYQNTKTIFFHFHIMFRSKTLFYSSFNLSYLSLLNKQPSIILNRKYSKHKQSPSEIVKLSYTQYDPPEFDKTNGNPYLIILHGLFGSKQNWKSLAKTFAQRLNTRVFTLVFETFYLLRPSPFLKSELFIILIGFKKPWGQFTFTCS
jgi:hypothetical protein